MAVLSKIRERSLLLILVIGFCLLAFVVGDVLQSGGFNSVPNNVGSVNGDDISYEDFRAKVERAGQGVNSSQVINGLWEQEVTSSLLNAEFDKLGLRVSEDQIYDVLTQNPQIGQNPMFQNEAGVFDMIKFKEYFGSSPELRQAINQERPVAELNAKYQIYNSLIKAATYTTTAEAKLKYEMESNKVSFDFVAVPYSTVNDSEVKISDDEIIAFMKKNEKKYKADETREVQFVIIEDKASAEDEGEVKAKITKLLDGYVEYNGTTKTNDTVAGFRNATDNVAFVNQNSAVAYDSSYVAKNNLPAEFAEQLYNLPQGQVFGPYKVGDAYYLSKSLGRQSGINAKASHILLAYQGAMRADASVKRTKEEAQAKANELLAQVKANPSSFMMLAMTNSDDSSKQQGGDLGYFSKGQMTPKFNDFVFNNPIGTIGLVETEFGFHIINVTDKQDGVRLATIVQEIGVSEKTSNEAYTKAQKFEIAATEKGFEAAAKESALTINPVAKLKAMDENIGQIPSQRQIVKWAFDKKTDIGDVKRYEVPNVGNVIVTLKKINEEGLMALDQARLMIEPKLKNEKKAAIIKEKLKGSTLEAMAKSANTAVQNAVDITIESGVLPGFGQEQKVVGTAIATAPNKVSAPIEGLSAVFVIQTKAVVKAPAIKDYKDYITKLKAQNAAAPGRVVSALKADADIEDNRPVFY